jgi:hypothetical protein
MRTRLSLGIVLAVGLAGPIGAETADCDRLGAEVTALTGLGAPPSGMEDGWCVLDGARTGGKGLRITVERLRVRGEAFQDRLTRLSLVAKGLRARPALDDRDMPDWLRDALRLQSAEVHLQLARDDDADRLRLEFGQVKLSGGVEVLVLAEIAGAEISPETLLRGRVTRLQVQWKNDGRTLRPVMEASGAQLQPGASGTEAVLATRSLMQALVAAMPEASLQDADAKVLEGFIRAMPQHRGRLVVNVRSDDGIGAAELGLLALAKDPTGPEALARFFAGTSLSVTWTPGFAP